MLLIKQSSGPVPTAVTPDRDQDAHKGTQRVSSVWGSRQEEKTPRQSPDTDVNSGRFKRREAVAWMEKLTGKRVAADHENAFRSSLADGVLLCNVANIVCPGVIQNIHGVQRGSPVENRRENVQQFLRAMQLLRVPSELEFGYEDLIADDEQEIVVDCMLWLKRLHEGHGEAQTPGLDSNDLSPQVDIPRKVSLDRGTSLRKSSLHQPMQLEMVQLDADAKQPMTPTVSSAATAQLPASNGVAQELVWWSAKLKQPTKLSSEMSPEALGSVFQNMLNSLKSDYEGKLSAKDQEVNQARDMVNALQSQLEEVQQQLVEVQQELEEQKESFDEDAMRGVVAREQEGLVTKLQQQLQEQRQQFSELQWQMDSLGQEGAQQVVELQQEVAALRERQSVLEGQELRYKATCDENRRLYNLVQDLKGSIRVFCRIRPAGRTGDDSASCMEVGEEGELAVHDPSGQADCRISRFDKVFGELSTQADVYADTQPLIRSVLDGIRKLTFRAGYNVCIFAYGQTGSGKTHTMSGTNVENLDGQGINYRALNDLFDLIEDRSNEMEYSIKVQMLEIYNESLRDLLVRDPKNAVKLELLNTMASGCNVRNAEQVDVSGPHEVMGLMERGSRNRAVAGTNMNERSSRSHQVLTVIVDGVSKITGASTHSCLNLVDLAGSERVSKSKAAGDRLVETCNINSSLSALGDVMAALAKKDAHVPFRNSKLTQLLADSLSGQAKVMMFMHISPEGSFMSETLSTLQFGTKVSSVTLGQAKRNVDNSKFFASEEVMKSRKELQEREDAVQGLQRKLQEERKQREQLQREVDKLKLHLDNAAKRSSYHEPTQSMESLRSLTRNQDSCATPASRPSTRPPQISKLNFSMPTGTPPIGSAATPTSARYGSSYKPSGMPGADSMTRKPGPVPSLGRLPPTNRSSSGAQTARLAEPSPQPAGPSSSSRVAGIYGMTRTSSLGHAPPASTRASGALTARGSSGVPTSAAMSQATPRGVTPRGGVSSQAALRSSYSGALPLASAGNRRASVGQWQR